MSTGVVTPTVPAANDIVLGECALYGNYELPTQIALGALQGGIKLQLVRKIEDIKFDGAYGGQLDVNGIPLKRYREFGVKLSVETLCLKYFNNKIISDCEIAGLWESKDWAGGGGVYTAETTIVLAGAQSSKCVADTTQYGIHEVFAAAKDLTVFDNAEASTTADYIAFAIYITAQDITDLGTAGIRLNIHKDAENTVTNLYYYDIAYTALVAGWNTFKIAKTSFTQTGTASWSAVTGISFQLNAAPSAEVTFYVDAISLLQNQSKSTILPLNGMSFFSMTDAGDYRKIVGNLDANETYYYENVAVVGKKHDGKNFIVVVKNVANDGKIERALKEKTEVVNGTEFLGHYTANSPIATPVLIRDYDV